ncbi:hypothetical protein LOD99_15285 [Oopsacas minuta]|uniref:HMG box domain-containing protein n=1 Tax=Oopsacas minuta TaxID=111878 RepID=A0AAV7KC77_9METZ|nr:hypothetical protein LOD99_15285 [Oopsacas minuta]
MLRSLLHPVNTLMKPICSLQIRVFSLIIPEKEPPNNKVNSAVKQFSVYLSIEFNETCISNKCSFRDTLGIMVNRWKRMKQDEKNFYYSGFEEYEGDKIMSKKSKFPKTTRIISIKNSDHYSLITDKTAQSLDSQSDDVIGTIDKTTPQKLCHVNGFSVFMHQQFRILSKKHPNIPSQKIFSKVAIRWRNARQEHRALYKKYARRIRARYPYAISGEINFNELFEEVLATTKTSGKILTDKIESDDYDYSPDILYDNT